jgi:hypothetical protein
MIDFVPAEDSFSGRALRRLGRLLGLRSETVYSRAILLLTLLLFALGGIVIAGLWLGLFRQFDLADEQEARATARNVRQFLEARGSGSKPSVQDLEEAGRNLGRSATYRETRSSDDLVVRKIRG